MTEHTVLREMLETDLKAVLAIEQEANPFPWSLKNFSDCLRAGYSAWVVCDDTAIIGFTIVQKIVDELHLLNICIKSSWQGQGQGKKLLAHISDFAEDESCKSILLEVRASNQRAQKLYLQTGFNEMSLRRNYYPAEKGREDAVLMAKELSFDAFFNEA